MGIKEWGIKVIGSEVARKLKEGLRKKTHIETSTAKTENEAAEQELKGAKKAKEGAKRVLSGTKNLGVASVAGAAAVGSIAGRTITGTGKAVVNHVTEGGSTNIFFFLAMIFHVIDSLFQYNATQLRFTVYFALGIIGWLWVFRAPGQGFFTKESWMGLIKSFIIAATAFFFPVLLPKYFNQVISLDMLNIVLAAWPIYLIYFAFIEPTTPFLHSIQKGIVFFWLIICIMAVYSAAEAGTLQNIPALQNTVNTDFLGSIGNIWKMFENAAGDLYRAIAGIPKRLSEGIERQMEYATGGYYAGKEEKTEEKLGVFLEELTPTNPELKENESIEIWGTLKVRSITNKPITITIGCNSLNNIGTNSINVFDAYGNDEFDIDCVFKDGFEKGSHKIDFFSTYSFGTSAHLKTYFINDERKKTMKKAGIDVFNEFGIKDRSPIAIHTSGPVKIGISTPNQPIGINQEGTIKPKIGFTIENTWEGTIKNITNLEIHVPKGMELDSETCDYSFLLIETESIMNVYKINETINDITSYRTFNCRTKISDESSILGNFPISTKEILIFLEYIFEIKKEIEISIK